MTDRFDEMTDQTQRVTDEEVAKHVFQVIEFQKRGGYRFVDDNVWLDLRDSRALTQSQAATIAEQAREIERLRAEQIKSCNIWHDEVLKVAAKEHWYEALTDRAEAAESALATATAEIERLEAEPVVAQLRGGPGWWVLKKRDGIYETADAGSPWHSKAAAYLSLAALEDKPHD